MAENKNACDVIEMPDKSGQEIQNDKIREDMIKDKYTDVRSKINETSDMLRNKKAEKIKKLSGRKDFTGWIVRLYQGDLETAFAVTIALVVLFFVIIGIIRGALL